METRKLTVRSHSDYTPLKRFYAWVGFLTIILGVPLLLFAIIAASHFISVELAQI